MATAGELRDSTRIHSVRQRLERWRRTRAYARAPIPAALWAAAVMLARQHGLYRTARALRLDYGALKAHIERADGVEDAAGQPTFVELGPVTAPQVNECVIELDAPRGTTRLRVSGVTVADLVALTRALGGSDA
jgi:hypothetical protein